MWLCGYYKIFIMALLRQVRFKQGIFPIIALYLYNTVFKIAIYTENPKQ